MRDEQLPGRAAAIGPVGLARFKAALADVEGVREVRGQGLWYGAELADAAWAARAVKLARERGVIVGRSGYDDSVIKLSPALIIGEAELHTGIDAAAGAIRDSRGTTR
jgi:acetylornithine/succinyldiaminopimelate/putrescine aminotransferase